MQDARRIFASGALGRAYALRGAVIADQTRIWPAHGQRDWTFKRSLAGGGHLVWLGIHWIDLMTFITESPVVEVQAMTDVVGGAPIDVEDLALVNLRLANGAYGSLVSGYLLDKPYQLDLSLWGSDGWLRFGAADRHLLEWHSASPDLTDVPDRQHRLQRPALSPTTPRGSSARYAPAMASRRRSPAPRPWPRCAWCTRPTSRPPADGRFGSRRSPSGVG